MASKTSSNKKKKNTEYYVDPKKFSEQIQQYYVDGIITDELGITIYNIANRMGYRSNFAQYTYREEMVGDAIIKMIHALKNKKFDPERGNAFSYYSIIAFNAFRNRIKLEKRTHQAIMDYKSDVYDSLIQLGTIPDDHQHSDHEQHQEYEIESDMVH